jgi:serine protease Do
MLPASRVAVCWSLCAVLLVPNWLRAEDTKIKWDPLRVTSPETTQELKALQEQVKTVLAKVSDSTVAILVGQGAGSGVIVSEDGLVLTAAHVIGKPGQIANFILADGTMVRGKTLGSNKAIDSGMARIMDKPPKDSPWPGAAEGKWPKLPIGQGTELKKGQWVVSLGHPGGPKRDRPPPLRVGRFNSYDKGDNAIKTDCVLVGGDSGGPLFDLRGNVVGIHSRIGLFLEMNIHVPSEAFKTDWDRMVSGDLVGQEPTVELGITFDENEDRPTVVSVTENGPAANAGIQKGDILVKIGGEQVRLLRDILNRLSAYEPGQSVNVIVERDGKMITVKVTLARKSRKSKK